MGKRFGAAVLGVGIAVALLAPATGARAARPELAVGLRTLVFAPFQVAGDALGAAGVLSGAVLGLGADAIGLLDANRFSEPLLGGVVSEPLARVAHGFASISTSAFEALRAEDVERLPEPTSAWVDVTPLFGRIDPFLAGLGALRLVAVDALVAPPEALLRLAGAHTTAESLSIYRAERRSDWVGPLAPAPD